MRRPSCHLRRGANKRGVSHLILTIVCRRHRTPAVLLRADIRLFGRVVPPRRVDVGFDNGCF